MHFQKHRFVILSMKISNDIRIFYPVVCIIILSVVSLLSMSNIIKVLLTEMMSWRWKLHPVQQLRDTVSA
jgi:hypothetical protein